jgi:hypothetical protein
MTKNDNGLTISAPLYDSSGKFLGEVKDNGYEITREENLTVEHSGDLSTLVVHDRNRNELLYVRYMNPNNIKVRGQFFCPSQNGADGIVVTDSAIKYMPAGVRIGGLNCISGTSTAFCFNCPVGE